MAKSVFPASFRMRRYVLGFMLIILIILVLYLSAPSDSVPPGTDIHNHADFKVYLNGIKFDFSQDRYMSTSEHALNEYMHLHDGDGDVIHQHKSGLTLGDFFASLNMSFDAQCFMADGRPYCNDGEKALRMYVNGNPNYQFGNYEFRDLDRILITYGPFNQTEIDMEISSITDRACIESGKCLERGVPSNEDCVSGSVCFQ